MALSVSQLFSVAGKNVAITGGARGIGRMIANAFVQNGANVYISSRKADVCEEAVKELNAMGPGKAFSFAADLSTSRGCRQFADYLGAHEHTKTQGLNVLVNNSGTSWAAPLESFPESGWDKVLDINLKSPFWLTQACLPLLKKGAETSPPARVINIGSITGLRPQNVPTYSYDISKAAVHHLTLKLANELAGMAITCNAIAPGWVPTDMGKQLLTYTSKDKMVAGIPLGREGREADMAGAALYLSSPAGSWVTGVTLAVDGGAISVPISMGVD